MKKIVFLGLLAIMLAIGFIACDNDPSNGGDEVEPYLLTGKFASQTGSGDAVFYADYVTTQRSVSRSVGGLSANEKELIGKIEDGDIIFNLRGVYDTYSNNFFLSAGSSILVYQIAGTLSGGSITSAEAAVKVKSNDEWTVITVPVTNLTSDVSINGSASNTQVAGIPQAWFGRWDYTYIDDEDGPITNSYTLTSHQFIWSEAPDEPAGILDFVALGGGKQEMVWEMYLYNSSASDDGTGNVTIEEWTEINFYKIWLEESGTGLLLTLFQDSGSDTFAGAKAFNTTTADPEEVFEINLVRPN